MGLFDKVLGTTPDKLSETDGFTGIILCAIAHNGTITQTELDTLVSTLGRMKLYRTLTRREFTKSIEKIQRRIHTHGLDTTLQQSATATPHRLRPTAYAIATDLTLTNGHLTPPKRRVLEHLQKHLQLDDRTTHHIIEVIEIKNRG